MHEVEKGDVMIKRISIALLLLSVTLAGKTLTFGVVPQQGPLKMTRKWSPVIEYLRERSGLEIRFQTEKSIPEFEKKLYEGTYDVAYMNPYHYVVAHHQKGYEAIARADKLITGILLVNKESGLSSIDQLHEKRFLFPAPFAFAATLLTKYELLSKYNIDVEKGDKVRYVNSHDSVYKGVARGIGDVGGGIVRTFNNLSDASSKEKLSIIYKTDAYPSHPIGILPSLSADASKKLQEALLAMPVSLSGALSIKQMIKTDNAEYDSVRNLAVKLNIMPE